MVVEGNIMVYRDFSDWVFYKFKVYKMVIGDYIVWW